MIGDESNWMEGLRKRDGQALGRLYDRYGRQVYALILRIVRDQGTAEDLVQETFLRVWNRAHLFDPGKGSVGGWLLTVARRQAIDYLRSKQDRTVSTGLEMADLPSPSAWRTSEHAMLNAQQVRIIREAFERLDGNHRMVLELAYFEGLTQTEMAERTRQPLGTIKTWVRLGLRALRKELGEAVPA